MDRNVKIHHKSALLVEGKDECNFFEELLKYLRINEVQIVDIGGKDQFPVAFESFSKVSDFNLINRLGFIRDAEKKQAQAAFSSICSILQKHQFPVPGNPNEIEKTDAICIGIFIMPDNVTEGMLENLCLKSIKDKPIYGCINEYIKCIKKFQSDNEKEMFNEPKAFVQTYLSAQSPIANSLGVGAKKGHWDFNNKCFDDIKKFLKELFQ